MAKSNIVSIEYAGMTHLVVKCIGDIVVTECGLYVTIDGHIHYSSSEPVDCIKCMVKL
jgi:hypothetical protein